MKIKKSKEEVCQRTGFYCQFETLFFFFFLFFSQGDGEAKEKEKKTEKKKGAQTSGSFVLVQK